MQLPQKSNSVVVKTSDVNTKTFGRKNRTRTLKLKTKTLKIIIIIRLLFLSKIVKSDKRQFIEVPFIILEQNNFRQIQLRIPNHIFWHERSLG